MTPDLQSAINRIKGCRWCSTALASGRTVRAKFCSDSCRHAYKEHQPAFMVRRRQYQRANGRTYRNTEGGRAVTVAVSRRQYVKFRDKAIARAVFGNAIKKGLIVRPKQCERCRVPCKPEGHHHLGYSRENRLKVQWLCKRCHTVTHMPHLLDFQAGEKTI